MKSRLIILFFSLLVLTVCSVSKKQSLDILICLNSKSPEVVKAREFLIPYMEHFGMPYHILDIGESAFPEDIQDHALIVIGHPGISAGIDNDHLVQLIRSAAKKGTGIVTFDPGISLYNEPSTITTASIDRVVFSTTRHFITASHPENDTLKFYNPLLINPPVNLKGNSLIENSGNPLLMLEETNTGKLVIWTSMDWMNSEIFGPLKGLDDCLWKSFVWAARKPFIMHSLPPVVTMRVDDVAARGRLWDESPLYWVKTANSYGFRPWLGLFIYNLNPDAINELRSYLINGQATAFPHAFGRPNRTDRSTESYMSGNPLDAVPFYYYPDAIAWRADSYDEFIYYDHHNTRPWTDKEELHGLNAVMDWYDMHQPLPVSSCLIPHWYEMGNNCARFVKEKWGAEFSCFPKIPNKPYADSVEWLVSGPYRLYEKPGSSTAWTRPGGQRPVYYADFINVGGETFFNCLTEIRDDARYEWAPDNDVEATVGRGVRQLERAMNSLAPAVLFTHETDYIYRIRPENWDSEMKQISEGIAEYRPRYMLLDNAMQLVKTYHTSRLESVLYDSRNGSVDVDFTGYSEASSSVTFFNEKEDRIISEYIDIKPFKKDTIISLKLLLN
jgi:hypothetical protein